MARVTGIGGIFLKASDPKALTAWYAEHLGIKIESWGSASLLWSDEVPAGTGQTTWALFPQDSTNFGPGPQTVMVNYRVDDLDGILAQLEAAGATIDPKRDDYDFGRFAWASDPEGNRFELWQPIADAPPES